MSSSAVGLTATAYTIAPSADANHYALPDKLPVGAIIQVVGGDSIYWTIDGTTPTSAIGFLATDGDFISLESFQQIKEFKAIRVTGDTSLEVVYLYGN